MCNWTGASSRSLWVRDLTIIDLQLVSSVTDNVAYVILNKHSMRTMTTAHRYVHVLDTLDRHEIVLTAPCVAR
jgi:hypothetical protein